MQNKSKLFTNRKFTNKIIISEYVNILKLHFDYECKINIYSNSVLFKIQNRNITISYNELYNNMQNNSVPKKLIKYLL
jgi:hypothetical protein